MNSKIIKKLVILILVVTTIIVGIIVGKNYFGKTPYEKDFEFLYDFIKEDVPIVGFKEELYGVDFFDKHDEYAERISKVTTDEEFFKVMNGILIDTTDGHIRLINEDMYKMISGRMRDIMKNPDKYIGDEKLSKNQRESFLEEIKLINNFYDEIESNKKTKKLYNLDFNEKTTDLEEDENKNSDRFTNEISFEKLSDSIAYIRIPTFVDTPRKSDKDNKEILDFLEDIKDYKNLIIDIRNNGGGNDMYWQFFLMPNIIGKESGYKYYNFINFDKISLKDKNIKSIATKYIDLNNLEELSNKKFESLILDDKVKDEISSAKMFSEIETNVIPDKNSINYKGKIYVFADEDTASSSLNLVKMVQEGNIGTIVGTSSLGLSDNRGGENFYFPLPNTGYIAQMPISYGLSENGTIKEIFEIEPDIKIKSRGKWEEAKEKELQDLIDIINKDNN